MMHMSPLPMALINWVLPPHAIIRPLNVDDVDAVQELETKGFPEAERMSREKTIYRLSVCPELSSGVFIRTFEDASADDKDEDEEIEEVSDFDDAEGAKEDLAEGHLSDATEQDENIDGSASSKQIKKKKTNGVQRLGTAKGAVLARTGCKLPHGHSTFTKERLIAQIIGTKMASNVITEEAMEIPDLDEYLRPKQPSDPRGHHEDGRTIGIHSVVVDPEFQGKSVGTVLLKDYIQRITTQHIADSIAIIAHDHLTRFYGSLGFDVKGPSACTFGNGGWLDLIRPISEGDEDEYDEDA